jgi:hypothetical protein
MVQIMATLGEALEALEDFRTDLVNEQAGAVVPEAQAMAFRSWLAAEESPLRRVHATVVGVRADRVRAGPDGFVIKVYVFERSDVSAAASEPLLSRPLQGVEIDVEYLPIQVALGRARSPRTPAAANPAQHRRGVRPVPGGVEIGPLGGNFVGTLGCFVRRGPQDGPLFILSNNHVLADVNRFPIGTQFTQPFSTNPADVVASLSDFEPIRFPAPGSQPRNVIDAAIAGVADPGQVAIGRMLNIANYNPQLLAARPGMAVIKSGRTTGVTTGTIRAIRVRGALVNFGTRQNPIIATFDNAITISGPQNGPAFSAGGDSGSVILDQESGRPVALLFAGDGVTTTACDVAAACARFNVHPV